MYYQFSYLTNVLLSLELISSPLLVTEPTKNINDFADRSQVGYRQPSHHFLHRPYLSQDDLKVDLSPQYLELSDAALMRNN